jgi:hypothetical protein
MKVARRTNLLWGIVFLGVAILVVLSAFDVLPPGIADLAGRAWPVLLVLVGLSIFLRDRLPLGGLIALVISGVLVAGVAVTAFSTRTGQVRDDQQQAIAEPVSPNINLLRISLNTLETDVELVRSLDERSISGVFTGSTESDVQVAYLESADNTASLTITETHPNQFPMLEAVGRGRLRVELPTNIPLDVNVEGGDGVVSLNMSDLALERLNLDWPIGDALVTLPEYDPQGSPDDAVLGALVVGDGDITVFLPSGVAGRFELNRGASGLEPVFDAVLYNYLVGDILEARSFDSAAVKVRYVITAPRGLITVTTTETP